MSWIVQTILRSSVEIKSKLDIDSEEYTNLIIIEKKIQDMRKEGLLSEEDVKLLEHISDGKPLNEAGDEISKSRITLARKFYAICERIAYSLGGEFTDEGYLMYMQKKYHLTEEEIEKLKKYMRGRYRYKIMRKI